MANMDVTQRTQVERSDLRAGGERIRHGSERAATAYTLVALAVGAALCAAALATISSWAQWVVLGAIVATTAGVMIALSPTRRGL